jgi:hypothetical protein
MEKMETITIRLNYCLADHEIQLANIDKLKLIIYLCEIKLEKDIDLPFKDVTLIGTDYISDDYALTKALKRVVDQSRKIGVVFNVWEKWEQKKSDFSDRKHNVAIVKTEQSIEDLKQSTLDEFNKVHNQIRIVYLEDQLAKIKSGTIKTGDRLTDENLNDLVKCYENELKELKR